MIQNSWKGMDGNILVSLFVPVPTTISQNVPSPFVFNSLPFLFQLHFSCLDLVVSIPPLFRLTDTYQDHCIDMIRQVLMCHAEPAIKTFVWVEGWARPYPDNVARHECRDFEGLDRWARERAMPHEAFLALDNMERDYEWPNIP